MTDCGKCQEWEDTVIEACNEYWGRTISPGLCPDCDDCRSDFGFNTQEEFNAAYEAGKVCDEGGFSYHDCECCGSTLGGDRFAAHGLIKDNKTNETEIAHLSICMDCLFYLANGDSPGCHHDDETS